MKREHVKRELMKYELTFGMVTERLKRALELTTDTELAAALGMSTSNYANRKAVGSIPFEIIIPLCISRSVSLDWLCTGVGPAFADGRVSDLAQIASIEALLLGDVVSELMVAFGATTDSDRRESRKIGIVAALVYNQVAPERGAKRRLEKIKEAASLLASADRLRPDADAEERVRGGRSPR